MAESRTDRAAVAHHLAAAFRNSRVECRCLPAIFFCNQPHLRRISPHNFRGAIRRAIIHDNYFALRRREILLEHAVDRGLNEPLVVVRIDENAELHVYKIPERLLPART